MLEIKVIKLFFAAFDQKSYFYILGSIDWKNGFASSDILMSFIFKEIVWPLQCLTN